jgi:hypothetical protein
MDRVEDPRVRSATANVALQGLHNIRGTRIGVCGEKADAVQNHPGRAVGALKRLCIQKCLLNRMQSPVLFESFNCGNGFCSRCADWNLARSARRSAM